MSRHARPVPRKRTRAELRREKIGAYFAFVVSWFTSDFFIEIGLLAFFLLLGAGAAYFAIQIGW